MQLKPFFEAYPRLTIRMRTLSCLRAQKKAKARDLRAFNRTRLSSPGLINVSRPCERGTDKSRIAIGGETLDGGRIPFNETASIRPSDSELDVYQKYFFKSCLNNNTGKPES